MIFSNFSITRENKNAVRKLFWDKLSFNAQLLQRTNHTIRFFTAQLCPFNFEIARQNRTNFGYRHFLTFFNVLGAAYNLHWFSFSDVN